MATILKNKDVIIKKEHSCFSCLRKFPVNTKMRYEVNKNDDGDFGTVYICNTCLDIMNRSNDYEWESGYVDNQLQQSQTPEELLICLSRYKKL